MPTRLEETTPTMLMTIVHNLSPGPNLATATVHLTDKIITENGEGVDLGVVFSFFIDGEQRACIVGRLDEFRALLDAAALKQTVKR